MTGLWTAGGFLSWLSALYFFSYVLSPLVLPTVSVSKVSIASIIFGYALVFFMMHISDFLMALLVSMALAVVTGRNTTWIIGFIVGAVGYTVYASFDNLFYYMGTYDTLPSWALVAWIQSLISSFIIIPLLSLLGVRLGITIRRRRDVRSRQPISTG